MKNLAFVITYYIMLWKNLHSKKREKHRKTCLREKEHIEEKDL